jgi:hypothetical protein
MAGSRQDLIPVIETLEAHADALADRLLQAGHEATPLATAVRQALTAMQRQLRAYDRADPTVLLVEPLERLRDQCIGELAGLRAELDTAIAIAQTRRPR